MTTRSAAETVPDSGLAGWALDVMEALGPAGAAALVALENLVPPIPSEVVLPLAGFAAGQGRFGLVEVVVWLTAGSTAGALVLYALGAWLGVDRVRRLADRVPLVAGADVEKAAAAFARRGRWYVLGGRVVPVVRSLVSVPAGATRMPVLPFVLLTAAGSAVWNSVLVVAGWALGQQWHRVEAWVGTATWVVLVVAATALVVALTRRVRTRRRPPHLDGGAGVGGRSQAMVERFPPE